MHSLRNTVISISICTACILASDDFELPEEIESAAPVLFAPIETESVAEESSGTKSDRLKSVKESDARRELPAGDSTHGPGIISRKIPAELSRPVRVGIFTDVNELYTRQGEKECRITATKGTLKIQCGTDKAVTASEKRIPQTGACTNVSNLKKTLSTSCFPGEILVRAKGNQLSAINTVDIEDYLKGVIPYEIGKLDAERFSALESQAIAARTYAYKHFGSRESLGFDIFADTKDQVYKGLAGATALTDSAVKKTRGIVMTYEGEFIVAYYHSTCGGVTETMETWGKESLPYLKSKSDLQEDGTPWCNESSYFSWERIFEDKELNELIKKNATELKTKIKNFNKIESISILDTLKSGRILTLEVQTDKGLFQVKGDKVRWLFKKAKTILPSSFFRIGHDNGKWIIRGKGFGHGVGMCQMGVRARAKAGESFEKILRHYYPGITLERFEK